MTMRALRSELRTELARVIVRARNEAEAGARKALEALAVERHEPHGSMPPEERALRNRLRAHGRQLGDVRDKKRGSQSIGRLTHEVAYEHWHRMMFARFLAENHLLIHPEHRVAVSLDELEELAREEGQDPHAMAARFAQASLPQIFRQGDPVLEVSLAPETRQALDKLLDGLPSEVFTADDSLGWTYQYWQSEKKEAVNESGNKIGADELPAVTQLFTEHYMVLFLFHNTIGAWHAGKVLAANPSLAETAQSEDELRQAVRLQSEGGYDFEYLRFIREAREGDEEEAPTGPWRPAAGAFEGWPKTAKELKVLDPCCGSGHFLTEGFQLLVRLRMDEEGLDLQEAIRSVFADNLHGLEIDPRCTQIAAFNLAMAAWKVVGKPLELPPLHIACSGLAVGSTKKEWVELAGKDQRLRAGMERLYDLFEQAPELGSLIDPNAIKGDMYEADFDELKPLLDRALAREANDVEDSERVVAAQGMATAAGLLADDYTLVITNVPYLGRGKQSKILRAHLQRFYQRATADLAAGFVERCFAYLRPGATTGLVTPQNWWFLSSYTRLRESVLTTMSIGLAASLGEEAWASFGDRGPLAALMTTSNQQPLSTSRLCTIDALQYPLRERKIVELKTGPLSVHEQAAQLRNPDHRITTEKPISGTLLAKYASSYQGISPADAPHYGRCFWEVPVGGEWQWWQSAVDRTTEFSGRHLVLWWNHQLREAIDTGAAYVRGELAWGRSGIACRQMRELSCCLYTGDCFDTNTAVIVPMEESNVAAIWCFCESGEFESLVRQIDKKVNVTNASLVKVPFDLERWIGVAAARYPNGLPEPESNDPTQWLFHGHPAQADRESVLQVAVSRLLGYRWPPELSPDMRLSEEAREWVARCDALKKCADEDGIACLSATRGERSAATRLRELLSAAFGSSWSATKERELLTADGKNAPASLDIWLRDKFFEEHCKLFNHRPFVWHIWDGNRDGFHCLVNAHKLAGPNGEGRRTLESITFSYLGDWIERQEADQADGTEGADARLAAARDLQGQLEKILEGEPPYDVFVRWKSLRQQAVGWEPDINDGVRLNIRPFMNAELRKGGRTGAGILRWKPNISWRKDRGKEPQGLSPRNEVPWFWSCPGDGSDTERTDFAGGSEFDGNRWNDLHYTRGAKEEARRVPQAAKIGKRA